MLIDDVTISVASGRGGPGAVAFQKNMKSLGPTGTSGGRGGNVYFEGQTDIGLLRQFRYKKELSAEDGQAGRGQFRDGATGADLILNVPVGTVIHNLDTGNVIEITKKGQRELVARGGMGGKGNFHFRSPHNTSPRRFQPGTPGESFRLRLELKLIADVGLMGLPNVGKSSLLNAVTSAAAKTGNYQFTTLEPNLGSYFGLILADIPGLIEGASAGRGLGFKFLRHIERTRVLFHIVSAVSEDPVGDYEVVRREISAYNPALAEKPEYILISKCDEIDPVRMKKIAADFSALSKKKKKRAKTAAPLFYSIHDPASLKQIAAVLRTLLS